MHYINSILHGSERHCVSQIGMKPIAFHQLCDILTQGEHIRLIVNMSVREQVLIFLHIIGHNVRFRGIGSRFLMQRGRVEAESVTHNYYNSSTKPSLYFRGHRCTNMCTIYYFNTILILDKYNGLKNKQNLHNLKKFIKSQYLP